MDIPKDQLRFIIGENVRNERIARDISMDELAELLDLSVGFVGLIERGYRGTTPCTLLKLADALDMNIDEFFVDNYDGSPLSLAEDYISKNKASRKKLEAFINDFSDEELDFILELIKNMRRLKSLP